MNRFDEENIEVMIKVLKMIEGKYSLRGETKEEKMFLFMVDDRMSDLIEQNKITFINEIKDEEMLWCLLMLETIDREYRELPEFQGITSIVNIVHGDIRRYYVRFVKRVLEVFFKRKF